MPMTVLPPLPGDGDPSPDHGCSPDCDPGFGWAERWDRAEPGPPLLEAIERVSSPDTGRLCTDELIGVLLAARRISSWSAAVQLAVLGDLAARHRWAAASDDAPAGEPIVGEVTAALNLTPAAAIRALELATAMVRLPATTAALRSGRIDQPGAAAIADELRCLAATCRPPPRSPPTCTSTPWPTPSRRPVHRVRRTSSALRSSPRSCRGTRSAPCSRLPRRHCPAS